MTINITPPLQDNKSFIVVSEGPRLVSGLITADQSPFPVELTVNTLLSREETPSISIVHLDSWRQRSAQAQLSAGAIHSCGVKADGAVACWGWNGGDRATPASAIGVDANTGFLSVSAGARHSCGVKADSAVACWGFGDFGQTTPTSSPQGVTANAGFLAVSAGGPPQLRHQNRQHARLLGL